MDEAGGLGILDLEAGEGGLLVGQEEGERGWLEAMEDLGSEGVFDIEGEGIVGKEDRGGEVGFEKLECVEEGFWVDEGIGIEFAKIGPFDEGGSDIAGDACREGLKSGNEMGAGDDLPGSMFQDEELMVEKICLEIELKKVNMLQSLLAIDLDGDQDGAVAQVIHVIRTYPKDFFCLGIFFIINPIVNSAYLGKPIRK